MTSDYTSRKQVKIFLVILALVIALGYIYFQSKNLISGPKLLDISPEDSTISEPVVTISGRAKNIAFITLNGRQIFVDDEGIFSEKIALSEGLSIVTINAKDRFGKQIIKTIKLFRPRSQFWPIDAENTPQNESLENSENLLEQT